MNKRLSISSRAKMMPHSPIRKLVPLAYQTKDKGIKVYHLNIGQPDIPTPPQFMQAVRNYKQKVLAYGDSQGDREYLKALAEYYKRRNIEVKPQDIVVTTGGSEAIIFAMLCVADTNEEVIVFEPFYPNYNGFARMADVKLVPITLRAENGFHLPSRREIEKKISGKTRAILVCSPNNPTGTVYTRKEMEMLADICKKNNLFLLSDEVYREFIYEGKHTSILHLKGMEKRGIIIDSISKRFSACGARIGCLVSKNPEVINSAWRMGQARLCVPSIEQFAAKNALKINDSYFKKMTKEYKKRRDVAYQELMRIPGTVCVKPSGAFYIMAKLPIADIEDFAKWMLTDFSLDGATTMIAPGPGFYATPNQGKDEARIAYVLNVADLRKAMRTLASGIKVYNNLRKK
ncbi:MAG: pyridoxal phosphate-dependent aminotransferase [candidate division Zixibacteria bacterium]|nr:pyridoxal phosphate-dependent aminotransferase [candidate division Zixibacteria bacterium]